MRTWLAWLILAALAPLTHAAETRCFDDAALHAVHFTPDGMEGWAVGDEGVIWHTIDGGTSWERQPTGVRASLRSIHFFNPLIGWVVGREELPLGAGSSGVLLYTNDGGERWQRMAMNEMPGLHFIHFVDNKTGFVIGEGSDQYPTGVFVTRDSGRKWQPVPGPRCPGWNAASFGQGEAASLVGPWNRLASLQRGQVVPTVVDSLGGRAVKAIHTLKTAAKKAGAAGTRTVAVGQGGLILMSEDGGSSWSDPEIKLPESVISCWDLHAIHGAGKKLWVAGRPGSVLLHSPDGGLTWQLQRTGQPLALHGLHFRDEKHGWAVGELGTILHTSDGGATWKVQQQGAKRAALLLAQARGASMPLDAVARVSDDGLLSVALTVLGPDPASAALKRASEADRLAAALRLAGGAAGEQLWQMPLADHLASQPRKRLLEHWDELHGGHSGEQLLRQLVLALRIWRPDVIITDPPGEKGPTADGLVGEALREAFRRAGEPTAFPEQLTTLGLKPWKPSKLYAPAEQEGTRTVALNLSEVRPRLQTTLRDFSTPAAGLLSGQAASLPRRRFLELLASHLDGADGHKTLFEGIEEGRLADARRKLAPVEAMSHEQLQAIRTRINLEAMTELPLGTLNKPEKLLASAGSMLDRLPDLQGAAAAHVLASHLARQGQWHLAREAFVMMIERYPAHPLTADAYRWLIRHNASSETRRRHEMGQFLVTQKTFSTPGKMPLPGQQGGEEESSTSPKKGEKPREVDTLKWKTQGNVTQLSTKEDILRWHRGSLELEPKLVGFGPLLANDPSVQFCLHAARRNLGDFETPRKWFSDFVSRQPAGPWRDAAAAELWLTRREGTPPRPAVECRQTETRPFLDGKLDDVCWQKVQPAVLRDPQAKKEGDRDAAESRDLARHYLTKAWLTYDNEFLYVALRCEHPAGHRVAPVKGRKRDDDLRKYDRVSLLLDLDRDYATAFQFQVDQRGCVQESCWGDRSWDPRWFVAVHSEEDAWQIEAAIPLASMTSDIITSGRTWACNVIRTLPGKGLQAFSLPAGVPEEDPRLEGMGLMMFRLDPRLEGQRKQVGQMKHVQE